MNVSKHELHHITEYSNNQASTRAATDLVSISELIGQSRKEPTVTFPKIDSRPKSKALHAAFLDWLLHHSKRIFNRLDISARSRQEYLYRVKPFLVYCAINGIHADLFLEYKRILGAETHTSISHKNKALVVARIFLRELHRAGLIPQDISSGIRGFRQHRGHKRFGFTTSEIQTIQNHLAQQPRTRSSLRLLVLFYLLAYQGLRQIEVTRLDVEHVDMARDLAYIQGKGRDDKEPIHLHPSTKAALQDYLAATGKTTGPLICSFSPNISTRFSTYSIQRLFHPIFKHLNIQARTVHGFRHYYTTTLLQSLDINTTRKFTRHRSLDMLIVYEDNLNLRAHLPKVFSSLPAPAPS
jgi:integrase